MKTKKHEALNILRHEVARRNFWQFCLYFDKEIFETRLFLKEIAEAFQDIEEGNLKSLSVSMPPRAGKSYITTLFCAWTLGRNPTESIMRNTCTATLYAKFSYDVRAIVQSEKFAEVFPTVKMAGDKANLIGWNTNQSKQVGYFGAGVGGTIIGFGATKVAITDDLYKGIEDAINENSNDKILQWKEATHDSRLEKNCAKIDIGTRWSINDVIGTNIIHNRYEKSIIVPALNSNNETFCSEVMSTEQYIDIKSRISPSIWIAEYMQEPVDQKGRLFNSLKIMDKDEFKFIEKNFDGTIAYIDVSDQGKDYTAMAICGMIGQDIYVIDYVFSRENTDVTIPLCAEKLNKWKVGFCRVESNAMGAMFSRSLQHLTTTKILQVHNTVAKITRIIMQSATINNFTFLNNETLDCKQFMDNLIFFSKEGGNKNDDAPDCLAGLSMFMKAMFTNLNI